MLVGIPSFFCLFVCLFAILFHSEDVVNEPLVLLVYLFTDDDDDVSPVLKLT